VVTNISKGFNKYTFREEHHFFPEEGSDKFIRNIGKHLEDYMAY
jgi:hypothetical protein